MKYRTFIRSCRNWEQFARARKMTVERGLTIDQARQRCDHYNEHRTPAQVRKGTMMEFESL